MTLYTNSIQTTQPLIFVSGQTPDAQGYIPSTFESQAELVLQKLALILESHDKTSHDIVNMTSYLTDRNHLVPFRVVLEHFLQGHQPTMSLVFVQGLVHPEFKLEVDMIVHGD